MKKQKQGSSHIDENISKISKSNTPSSKAEAGVSSYYVDKLHRRATASGEPYNLVSPK